MPHTNRDLFIQVTRSTTIMVPAGTEVRRVECPTKELWAVNNAISFAKNCVERHDLTYYWAYVPDDAIDMST